MYSPKPAAGTSRPHSLPLPAPADMRPAPESPLSYRLASGVALTLHLSPSVQPYRDEMRDALHIIGSHPESRLLLFDTAQALGSKILTVALAESVAQAGLVAEPGGNLSWFLHPMALEWRACLLQGTGIAGTSLLLPPAHKRACAIYDLLAQARKWLLDGTMPDQAQRIDIDVHTRRFRDALATQGDVPSVAANSPLDNRPPRDKSSAVAVAGTATQFLLQVGDDGGLRFSFDDDMRPCRLSFVEMMHRVMSVDQGRSVLLALARAMETGDILVKREPALHGAGLVARPDGQVEWRYNEAALMMHGMLLQDPRCAAGLDSPKATACAAFDLLLHARQALAAGADAAFQGLERRLDLEWPLQAFYADLAASLSVSPRNALPPPPPLPVRNLGRLPPSLPPMPPQPSRVTPVQRAVLVDPMQGLLDLHFRPGGERHHRHILLVLQCLDTVALGRGLLAELRRHVAGPIHVNAVDTDDFITGGCSLQDGVPVWSFNPTRLDQLEVYRRPLSIVQKWALGVYKDLSHLRNACRAPHEREGVVEFGPLIAQFQAAARRGVHHSPADAERRFPVRGGRL
jgi:hypothetical protein